MKLQAIRHCDLKFGEIPSLYSSSYKNRRLWDLQKDRQSIKMPWQQKFYCIVCQSLLWKKIKMNKKAKKIITYPNKEVSKVSTLVSRIDVGPMFINFEFFVYLTTFILFAKFSRPYVYSLPYVYSGGQSRLLIFCSFDQKSAFVHFQLFFN